MGVNPLKNSEFRCSNFYDLIPGNNCFEKVVESLVISLSIGLLFVSDFIVSIFLPDNMKLVLIGAGILFQLSLFKLIALLKFCNEFELPSSLIGATPLFYDDLKLLT